MSQILFISRWFPFPPNNGSKLRIFNLLRGLAQQHRVTLLSFDDQDTAAADTSGLHPYCQDVQVVPWRQFAPTSGRAKMGFLGVTPRSVRDTWSPAMAQLIQQKLTAEKPDLIIASQIDTAGYVPRSNGVTALFEEVELGLMYEQFAAASTPRQRIRYGLTWAKHRRYLIGLLERFEACTVVSQRERQLLTAAVPGYSAAEVIPNFIDLSDYRNVSPVPRQNMLIFTGAFTYRVNYEGALWFVSKVYPLVRAQIDEVALTITGNHANLPLPDAENVLLTGVVGDVRPLIAGAAVSVVPIWEGGGTRLKILEAMALRTPVVTTSKGAEGLDARDGVHLLIADEPETFANAIVRLLRDHSLVQHLVDNAVALVEQCYDWQVVMPRFLQLVDRLESRRS